MIEIISFKRWLACAVVLAVIVSDSAELAEANSGLIAVYRDGQNTVHRVVPTPSFTLAADESVHSQIGAKFDAVYTGVLKISRGGEYSLSGDAKIEVGGTDVAGKTIKLTPGDHPLKVTYNRKAGPARLQLRWKSDFFNDEPIPPRAFSHEGTGGAQAAQWSQIERGRLLYEDLSCGACHGSDGWKLSLRPGPDLSNVRARVKADWLHSWVRSPRSYRKTSPMPKLLTDDTEIRDVATFLGTLGKATASAGSSKNDQRVAAGKEIFDRVGCNKCHTENGGHSLVGVGSKYLSSRALATFIADPLHVDPSGRMPQMFDPKTQAVEAGLVAEYLFHTKKSADVFKAPAAGDSNRGRELVQSRGCVSCHSIKEGETALTSKLKSPQFTAADASFDSSKGCLADAPAKGTADYQLTADDRVSLRSFLDSVVKQPVVAVAPVETFYRRVAQFNCTACHSLNDQNNQPLQDVDDDGKIVNIERPPSLTGAGDKLRVDWIKRVLLDKKRTRPWLKIRMPHFGHEMQSLPTLFAAAAGSPLKEESASPKMEIAAAGLQTIGIQRGQTACINCHDYRGINQQTEGVVPAPDMAEIGQTLRSEWFRRWLRDPQRIQPGTSMPRFFQEIADVKQREQKIDELWAALVHQGKLPLPKGLIDTKTEGTKIVVGDDPVVFRVATKITNGLQIDRAINVGLPGGMNFAFDAATARLRGIWKGEFINAGPAWNGRGGNAVNVLADSRFVPIDHFPIRIGSAATEPKVRFLGYYLVQKYPVFRYSVDEVEIHERIEPAPTELMRRFTIADAPKAVFFVDDKDRAYRSAAGEFKDGVLQIAAGKKLEFEVRRPLSQEKVVIKDVLRWNAAGTAKPPISKNGAYAAVIFENESNRRVKLVWVGYNGKLATYGELKPGETRRQNTYSNNTWLITDENDQPLGHFVVSASICRAVIPK
jgi:mono/diheme cytochrome c family protein